QSGIFRDSSRGDDWSDERGRRQTEARRRIMLRTCAQTEINRANKSDYSDCLPNLSPIFLRKEEHRSNHGEKEAAFFAQGAQEQRQAAGGKEQQLGRTSRARGPKQ